MKTKIRTLATGAALVAAVTLAPAGAYAFAGGDGPQMVMQHLRDMAAKLGLSGQQKKEIKTILQKDRDQFLPLVKQLKVEHGKLRSLVQAESVDEVAIREQSAKVAALQADLAVRRAEIGKEIRTVLTPEQILKLREMQAKGDERRERAGARFVKWLNEEK